MKTKNPYNANAVLSTREFLNTTYILVLKKIKRLIEIEEGKKKGKLRLKQLKEKFEETSKILEVLRQLITMLDYNNSNSEELGNILNDIGLHLGKANIAETSEEAFKHYNISKIILEAFLYEPK